MIIIMFTQQLSKFTIRRSRSPQPPKISHQINQVSDFHFQICSAFLKKTGEKLWCRQAQIIDQSSIIIQSLPSSFKDFAKEKFNTTQSTYQNPQSSYEGDPQERTILRKNISRKSDSNIFQSMKEVQQNCSIETIGVLRTIIEQYKKYQSKQKSIQAKQHSLIKKQEAADKYHQQNILLKKRLQAEEVKVFQLQQELNLMKIKNTNSLKNIQEKMKALLMNQKYVDINQKVYNDIKSFLNDKEIHINARMKKVQHIQQSILVRMEAIVQQSGPCLKCCELMRKIKDSILKYRNYLQFQGQQVDKLYNIHKKALFVSKNRSLN